MKNKKLKKGDKVLHQWWGQGTVEDLENAIVGEYGVRFKKDLWYCYEEDFKLIKRKERGK